MNLKYLKYLIYFLLGIFIFYIFKKDKIIEGMCPTGTTTTTSDPNTCVSIYNIPACENIIDVCGDPRSSINTPGNCQEDCRGILNVINFRNNPETAGLTLLKNKINNFEPLTQNPQICYDAIRSIQGDSHLPIGSNLADYLIDNYKNNCKCSILTPELINIPNIDDISQMADGIIYTRDESLRKIEVESHTQQHIIHLPCRQGYVGNVIASCNDPPNYTITGSCQKGIDKDQNRNHLYFNLLDLTKFTESSTSPLPIEFIDHPINVNNIEQDDYTNINTYLRNSEVSIIQLNPIITQDFLDVNFNYQELSKSWPGKGMGQNETVFSVWTNLFNFISINNPDYNRINQITVNDIKYFLKEISRELRIDSENGELHDYNYFIDKYGDNTQWLSEDIYLTPISIFMDNMDNISNYHLQALL